MANFGDVAVLYSSRAVPPRGPHGPAGRRPPERAVTELGEPEALFRISRGRFLAKLTLGVLLLVYGVVANYLWWVHGPGHLRPLRILFLLSSCRSPASSLLLHMYRNRGLFVLVYPTGLLRLRRGEVDSFPWHEVDHVRLKVQRADGAEFTRDPDGTPLACWLPADVPTFKLWNAGLTVAREDGVEAHFGPALTDYDLLAEEVQKRTFAALWPLRPRPVPRRRPASSFGDLEVVPCGAAARGQVPPLARPEGTRDRAGQAEHQAGRQVAPVGADRHGRHPEPAPAVRARRGSPANAFPTSREPQERSAEQR